MRCACPRFLALYGNSIVAYKTAAQQTGDLVLDTKRKTGVAPLTLRHSC